MTAQGLLVVGADDVSIEVDNSAMAAVGNIPLNSAAMGNISDRLMDDDEPTKNIAGGVTAFQPKKDHLSSR